MSVKLRRNDVVLVGSICQNEDGTEYMDNSYCMYGRVVKRINDTHVLVVDCGKYFQVLPDEWLEKQDYDGYFDGEQLGASRLRQSFPVWRKMPTLRKLKQITSRYYGPGVWAGSKSKNDN